MNLIFQDILNNYIDFVRKTAHQVNYFIKDKGFTSYLDVEDIIHDLLTDVLYAVTIAEDRLTLMKQQEPLKYHNTIFTIIRNKAKHLKTRYIRHGGPLISDKVDKETKEPIINKMPATKTEKKLEHILWEMCLPDPKHRKLLKYALSHGLNFKWTDIKYVDAEFRNYTRGMWDLLIKDFKQTLKNILAES